MITLILSLFSTSGFGALIGWIGGLANRLVDLKAKQMDIEIRKIDHDHERAMVAVTTDQLKMEWEARAQIASIEGQAKVEVAGYDALRSSHEHDRATYGILLVDGVRGMVRPALTLIIGTSALAMNWKLLAMLAAVWPTLAADQQLKLTVMAIEWTFFQASVVIGWWFANRPGSGKATTGSAA